MSEFILKLKIVGSVECLELLICSTFKNVVGMRVVLLKFTILTALFCCFIIRSNLYYSHIP